MSPDSATRGYSAPLLPLAQTAVEGARSAWRPRRAFVVALVISAAIHFAVSFWPDAKEERPETLPLQASLAQLPPPPRPVQDLPPKPRPKPKRVVARPALVRPPPPLPEPVIVAEEAVSPDSAAAPAGAMYPPPEVPALAPMIEPPTAPAPVTVEQTPPLSSVEPPAKPLPPRVDLVYRVFLGTQGFYIGSATYRFEHSGNRYGIATIGEAKGLAALVLRGQGKVESSGVITSAGLQPEYFVLERGNGRRREITHFDWNTGIVTLDEDKAAMLDVPTYDPLSFLWQFYFLPPATSEQTFAIATTKRITRYIFRREGTEFIELSTGVVETERWHRTSDDGKTDAFVWLAPTMHYAAVKLRFANTERGTVEALLDAIHVDPAQSP